MPLLGDAYGKGSVRMSKVIRGRERHEIIDLTVDVHLEGDLAAAYTDGDNSLVLPTDTMKNTVYVIAAEHEFEGPEELAALLTDHFLSRNAHLDLARVTVEQRSWERLGDDPHTFLGSSGERRLGMAEQDREGTLVQSGIDGLSVLRTSGSAFAGFLRDEYTTLPDKEDRIMATTVMALWDYLERPSSFGDVWRDVRRALLDTFATHESKSVQHTLLAMGEAGLAACPEVGEIYLQLPNQHHLPVDLRPFGIANLDVVQQPVDEPFGVIEGTVGR
ncbi:MAG: urate oxidase [Actinobacteria bacterium]|nr:MAG: urate oxidase [Actinomycetota bacterium]